MIITIKFNSKSTASVIGKSLAIANQLSGYPSPTNNKFMVVESDHSNKKIIKLLGMVSNIAKTEVTVDNKPITSPIDLYDVLSCTKKSYCDGHCTLGSQPFDKLLRAIGVSKLKSYYRDFNEYHVKNLYEDFPEIISSSSSNEITIDRDIFIKVFKIESEFIAATCEKYSQEIIVKKLEALPNLINVKIDSFFLSGDDFEESEFESDPIDKKELSYLDNNEEITVSLNAKQFKELSAIIADEFESRIRKLLDEYKITINKDV